MKNKKEIILVVVAVFTLMVFIVGATFAFFRAQSDEAKNVDVSISSSTTDKFELSTKDVISLSASQDNFTTGGESLTSKTTALASLTANNGTNSAIKYYYLYLIIENNTFTYAVDESTPELILTITGPDGEVKEIDDLTYTTVIDNKGKSISGFDITKTKGLITIADNKQIVAGAANEKAAKVDETWTITLTFVNYTKDQSDNEGASLSAKVMILKNTVLADTLLINEANTNSINEAKICIQNKGTPDFSENATTDEGLFATTDEDGIVYYFRGAVDDNHLLFGGFCWKIVRTTGTGGIKILYDGIPSSDGICNNTGSATIIGNYQYNTKYNSPAFVGYMYGETTTSYKKYVPTLIESVVFGNSVTYDKTTNTYTLVDTYTVTDPSNWEKEYTNVTTKHYTCFSSSDNCQTVNYINTIFSEDKYCYYVTLSNGQTELDILERTLGNVENSNNSNIKKNIDSWFKSNLLDKEQYLEDTVFCNDREYSNISTSGWNKDYSNYDGWLKFNSHQRLENKKPNLTCSRTNDKFTVNEDRGNGDLTYPVGLITADEMALAGGVILQINTSYYLYNEVDSWSLSPYYFTYWHTIMFDITSSGKFSNIAVTHDCGTRPLVSLKPGIQIESGNGSKNNPYVIKLD